MLTALRRLAPKSPDHIAIANRLEHLLSLLFGHLAFLVGGDGYRMLRVVNLVSLGLIGRREDALGRLLC